MIPDVFYYTDRKQNQQLLLWKETYNFSAKHADILFETWNDKSPTPP